MTLPLTTPCAHNFCKSCLQGTFAGQTFMKERTCEGRRTLRAQKNIMKCPSCFNDISEYLRNPQVNRELMSVIESLQRQTKETEENTVLGEETPDTDEETGKVKDEKPESEMKDMDSDANNERETSETCLTDDGSGSDTTAKPSPKSKGPKNKKQTNAGAIDTTLEI